MTLRMMTDEVPGLTRRRAGTGWSYRGPDGLVTSKDERARIEALAIPPAYVDVWISPSPDTHLQATGRDAEGRKQYIYHPHWLARRALAKYDTLAGFAEALPDLRARLLADRRRPRMDRRRILAIMVTLLDRAHLRIGSEDYLRQHGTRGLTTLTGRHLVVEGAKMTFQFPGKSGQARRVVLRDPALARTMQDLQGGPRTPLFRWRDGRHVNRIMADEVNAYLREVAGEAISAKTFRTWAGTVLCAGALEAARKSGRPLDAVEAAASHLGNTPNVARESYIHPRILDLLEADQSVPIRPARPLFGRRALSVTETDVTRLIG